MKVFLKKFLLFGTVWVLIFSLLYILTPKQFYFKSDYGLFLGINNKIEADGLHGNIIIGDSRPQFGINAKYLHALNLSTGGECTVEGYYEARAMLQNKTNHIDTLFISYSMQHLLTQECFYWDSYYYGIINSKYLDTVREQAASFNDVNYQYKASFGLFSKIKKLNTPAINQQKEHIKEFILQGFNSAYHYIADLAVGKIPSVSNQLNHGRYVSFSTDTVRFNRSTDGPLLDDQLLSVKQSQVNQIYLDKIIQLCDTHHVTAIFIITPVLHSNLSQSNHPEVFVRLHQKFGKQIIQDTSSYADSYFRDGKSHLNIYGINRFNLFLQKHLYGTSLPQITAY